MEIDDDYYELENRLRILQVMLEEQGKSPIASSTIAGAGY